MNIRALPVILAVCVAGCGGNGDSRAASDSEKPALPALGKATGEIELDAARQRNAGIVVDVAAARTLREAIEATGTLAPDEQRTWRVGALTTGRIVEVRVNAGDSVRKGQIIATLHSHEVHESRANYRQAETELERAQAAEQHALRVRDRARRLFDLKAASREQVEIAENEYRNAQAHVATAHNDVEKAQHHLTEFLDVPLEGTENIPIRAPASGLVTDRRVTPGMVVSAGDEIATITDPASIWMIAAVDEADLSHLRVGQAVRVKVRAWPDQSFPGRIVRLGEHLDPDTRRLQVRVGLANPGGRLKPEMYATAEIEGTRAREAVIVPDTAVQEVNGQKIVFVQSQPGRFNIRPVQTARNRDGFIEITAGLEPGERFAARGGFVLKSQLLASSLAGDE